MSLGRCTFHKDVCIAFLCEAGKCDARCILRQGSVRDFYSFLFFVDTAFRDDADGKVAFLSVCRDIECHEIVRIIFDRFHLVVFPLSAYDGINFKHQFSCRDITIAGLTFCEFYALALVAVVFYYSIIVRIEIFD